MTRISAPVAALISVTALLLTSLLSRTQTVFPTVAIARGSL